MQNENVLASMGSELTEADLIAVVGGAQEAQQLESNAASAGYICSLSGECNTGGTPCNPLYWGH